MSDFFQVNRCRTCKHDCWVPQYVLGCKEGHEVHGIYENEKETLTEISKYNTDRIYEPNFWMVEIIRLQEANLKLKNEITPT